MSTLASTTQRYEITTGLGEEEKNRKRKEEQKKKHGAGPQPSYLDHSVASYDPHGSYGEHILKPPHPQGEIYTYIYISCGLGEFKNTSCMVHAGRNFVSGGEMVQGSF